MADNETLDWNDLANTQLGTVERPPLKPAGHYQAVITGRGKQDKTPKGTLYIEFPIQVNEAMSDVDTDELEAAGGPNFKGNVTVWLTAASLWRFKELAQGLGASDDMGVLEAAEYMATCGEPIVVTARHEPGKQEGEFFLRLENPMPLSAWQARQAS